MQAKRATAATTVISVVSTKGGAGKTTTAANLGGLAAALGQRVLLIDADVQPSLTKYFVADQHSTGMNEVIGRGGVIIESDIVHTSHDNLHLIASNMQDHVQAWLKEREDRLVLLRRAVRQPLIRDNYDLVIIDTQGAKGELQKTAAMAADLMVSPVKPDVLNYTEFGTGTLEMLKGLNALSDVSPELRAGPLAIFINCLTRTTNAKVIEASIRERFRQHPTVRLLDTTVPQHNAYVTSRTFRQPVHAIDKHASLVMHKLLHDILPHLKGLYVGAEQTAQESGGVDE